MENKKVKNSKEIKMSKEAKIIIIISIIGIMVTIGYAVYKIRLPILAFTFKDYKIRKENEAFVTSAKFPNDKKEIKDFQVGKSYSVILYEDGTVWVAGSNYVYSSRRGYDYGLQKDKFTKVKVENIEKIAVGDSFVIALNNKGEVYTWGSNDYGELGRNGYKVDDAPKKIELENIKEIFVDGNKVAALSNNNEAYYWGYATKKDYNKSYEIFKIDDRKIDDIFLAGYKYFFKTHDNKILALGFGFDGMTDEINGWATKPIEIDITDVRCIRQENYSEDNKTYIIKNDGSMYTLETSKNNELTKVDSNIKIKDIFLYTSSYNEQRYFLIDENDRLYYNDKCILENVKLIKKPIDSHENILILTQNGEVYNFGNLIDYYAYKEGAINYSTTPIKMNVNNVKLMGISDIYAILIDNNNKIYKLGKSEHGALGIKENEIANDFGTGELRTYTTKNDMRYYRNNTNETSSTGEKIFIDSSLDTIND